MTDNELIEHLRRKVRRLELRADGLDRHRRRLEQILLVAVEAAAGQDCDPLVLLSVIEEMLDAAGRPRVERSIPELVALLRETDPDGVQALRAA